MLAACGCHPICSQGPQECTRSKAMSSSDGQGKQVFYGAGQPAVCTAAGHSRPLPSIMEKWARQGQARKLPLVLQSSPYCLLPNTRKPYINIHAHPKCKPVFIYNTYHIPCAHTHKYIQTKKTTHKDRHTNTTQINVLYHIQ